MKVKYCSCGEPISSRATRCQSCANQKSRNPAWKGGRLTHKGYVLIFAPDNPMAEKNGYVYEHRLVMSQILGRPLLPEERVHHRDENKSNNAPENLQLFRNNGHHCKHHGKFPNPKKPEPLGWRKHKSCPICGVSISDYAKGCRRHMKQVVDPTWKRNKKDTSRSLEKKCLDCGKPIVNKADYCRPCSAKRRWQERKKAP